MLTGPGPNPVDVHVHLHPDFEIARCLSAAARNMPGKAGILMLAEFAGREAFSALPKEAGAWTIRPTAEPVSRVARRPTDGAELYLVAGRQIVTREGLEVLALGTLPASKDGQSLDDTLRAVRESGALAVLPWGVGKWTGRRGRLVDALISREAEARDIFLADSGVRAALIPRPRRLVAAESVGWRVLAGTDPLRLAGEERKCGRFGFLADVAPEPDRPFAALADWLRQLRHSPQTYGKLESLPRFLRQQLTMQLCKRLG